MIIRLEYLKTSRIFWGLLFDRIGYKRSTITIAVCVCLGVTALPLLQFLGGIKDQTKSSPWKYCIFIRGEQFNSEGVVDCGHHAYLHDKSGNLCGAFS